MLDIYIATREKDGQRSKFIGMSVPIKAEKLLDDERKIIVQKATLAHKDGSEETIGYLVTDY